jgi:hypothetical protein
MLGDPGPGFKHGCLIWPWVLTFGNRDKIVLVLVLVVVLGLLG